MNENERFEQITTDYLAELYAAQPVMATGMGVHDYDDLLPDLQPHAVAADLRRARAYLHEIDRLSLVAMSPETRIDYRLARADTQMAIAYHEQVRRHQRQPSMYVNTAVYGTYLLLEREYADASTRGMAAACRLRAIPEFLNTARRNLADPPRVFTEVGIEAVAGARAFLAASVPAFTALLEDEALRTELADAATAAGVALDEFGRFLRDDLLPRSTGDFAIGNELFDYSLRIGHFLQEDGDALLRIGLQTIEETREEMARVADYIEPGSDWETVVTGLKKRHPPATDLVATYAAEMQRTKEFVELRRLVHIPPGESLEVVETPEFARPTLPYAAYCPAAPFEEQQKGTFWVTPVDPSQPADRQEAQLQGHSKFAIVGIALHEGYPGHHLQFSVANRVPSRFRRHFARSNLFVEGWALYCEEMMYEAGLYSDPRVRLMQLKDQLWRACRVVLDVSLHTRAMTPEEAVRYLVEVAKQEEANARAEVKRYVLSPTQPMSYIMGKRLIREIRTSLEKRLGARFDLRRFHNELLSYGSVPPRLVREEMVKV